MRDVHIEDLTKPAIIRRYKLLEEGVLDIINAANRINILAEQNLENSQELKELMEYYDAMVNCLPL